MTRINRGIPVRGLNDVMLFSEHREMKRICALYRKGTRTTVDKFIVNGPGHVQFFADKPSYTFMRQVAIEVELKDRGMKFDSYLQNWVNAYADRLHWIELDKCYHFDDGIISLPTINEAMQMATRIMFCIDRQKRETSKYRGDYVFDKVYQKNCLLQAYASKIPDIVYKYDSKFTDAEPADYLHCCWDDGYAYVFIWDTREIIATKQISLQEFLDSVHSVAIDYCLPLHTGNAMFDDLQISSVHWNYLREIQPKLFTR